MELTRTARGFEIVTFIDRYDADCAIECSIQQSSAIGDQDDAFDHPGSSFLWIGPTDANPRIMASHAAKNGIATIETTGWVKYQIPEDVLLTTRMHVSREQVGEIIKHLQAWLDTGSLAIKE